ncbi:Calcitonin receptor-like protein 1 [Dirofilaria immitis]|nr:Calcitonin receptor-like protein 1 [Dirofilaria immitis]
MDNLSTVVVMQPSTSWAYSAGTLVKIDGLEYNRARTMDECIKALERSSLPTFPDNNDGSLWCNATFDTVLCWPAIPANSSITVRCPPLKGLDPGKNITKWCHSSGHWMGRTENDFSRPHGWTNFTMCLRKKRLRVFRNLLHLQLMIAILMVVVIRLILYIDLIFTDRLGPLHLVFAAELRLRRYLTVGYVELLTGLPLVQTFLWLTVILMKKQGKVDRCLGSYYLEPEFWLLDGPRMLELVVNLFFICNVIRVLWTKVRQSHNTSELDRMKKSVKAAVMLIPLLGIPNIMQTIPFSPTKDNIVYFAIWTYCASFTYMYQGFMISIIYCFTNKEVRNVLKTHYGRLKLQHTSTANLRHGSRANVLRNGNSIRTSLKLTEKDRLLKLHEHSTKNGSEHDPTTSAFASIIQDSKFNESSNSGEASPSTKMTKKKRKTESLNLQLPESKMIANIPTGKDNSQTIEKNN